MAPRFSDLLGNEVPERGDSARLPQLLGIGEVDRHVMALHLRQDADEAGNVELHVAGQDADPETVQDALEDAEIGVHQQPVWHLVAEKLLDQRGASGDLDRAGVLADQAMRAELVELLGGAVRVDVVLRRVKAHADGHQPAADQVGLARLLEADGDVGLAHGQVEHALLEHEVDVEVGVAVVEMLQPGRQPERAEAHGGGDAQLAEHLLLAVLDAGAGGLEALGHGAGRIEQELALLGQDQAAGVAVEERGRERLLQPADLPADGGLRQAQRLAGMGERARVRDRVEDAQLVPVHDADPVRFGRSHRRTASRVIPDGSKSAKSPLVGQRS